MATMTLRYDARNNIANKAIEFLLSLGIFDVLREDKMSSQEKKTLKAIKEIENGGGIVCNSFDDYLKAVE